MSHAKPYDAANYDGQVLPSRRSAEVVMPFVVELLSPSSVLDVGCGAGAWMAAAGDLGIDDVVGIEGGHPTDDHLQVPRERIRTFDLRSPIDLRRRFDLTISVEVAEHIPAEDRHNYLRTLTNHSDAILFSAAIPDQSGAYHVNEQWPDYWSTELLEFDFQCFDPWRLRLWDDDRIEWWYRQNVLLFARGDIAERLEDGGLRAGTPKRLVHPSLFLQTVNVAQAPISMRGALKALAQASSRRLHRGQLP